MESEPGSVWTLVMSFTRALANRFSGMYEDAPANEYSPNWSNYRMSLNQMTDLKNKTTHWRATCSFPTYRFDIHTDYVRAVFTDFDLMGKFSGECKKVDYISVMRQSCPIVPRTGGRVPAIVHTYMQVSIIAHVM